MFIYREKNNLIHKLHPCTIVSFIGAVFLLSLIFTHPIYLLGLLVAVGIVIIAAGNLSEWMVYLKYSVMMLIVIMIVNAIFVQAGHTVLFVGPKVPVLGRIKITLEALAYGAGMGIRLLVIISVFCLYTYSVQPDKVLNLFSSWGNKSVLAITLSTRLFPLMMNDFKRITEIQRCRGVKFDTGKWWERAKNLLPVISVMLLSCLERALQLAESMHARGYGSGSRSIYSRDLWRPRDYIILIAVVVGLIIGVITALKGWSSYSYYPRLVKFSFNEVVFVLPLFIVFIIPAILNWGWSKWLLFRLKI